MSDWGMTTRLILAPPFFLKEAKLDDTDAGVWGLVFIVCLIVVPWLVFKAIKAFRGSEV